MGGDFFGHGAIGHMGLIGPIEHSSFEMARRAFYGSPRRGAGGEAVPFFQDDVGIGAAEAERTYPGPQRVGIAAPFPDPVFT